MRKAFNSKLIPENAKNKTANYLSPSTKAQHRKEELPLPLAISKFVLANRFSDNFDSKISKIIMEINQTSDNRNKLIKLVTIEISHTIKQECTKNLKSLELSLKKK